MSNSMIFHPNSIRNASELLLENDLSIPYAGGTEILILRDKGLYLDHGLVLISSLGLNYIESDSAQIIIGATTTINEVESSPFLRETVPVLTMAAKELGSLQLRTTATIGGNLCAAVPCADTAVPLLVLNASVEISNVHGKSIVPINEFFLGPRKTVLKKGDILTQIIIPMPAKSEHGCFLKVGRRRTLTLATSSVAVQMLLREDRIIEKILIGFGAVAPTPIRAYEIESFLAGKAVTAENLDQACALVEKNIKPISDIRASKEYRLQLSKVLMKRAIEKLTVQE